MISFRSLLVALTYGSIALALPMPGLYRRTDTVMMSSSNNSHSNSNSSSNSSHDSNSIAGAAFFITNEPDGNFIVAAALSDDGSLVFDRAVSTRGQGAHGISDPNGPDPLFSQGSIKASQEGEVIVVVNAGSNTVSLFSIDAQNPVIIEQIGQPVSSEGEFPVSVALNKDGSQACVLNGGAVNGVNCFKVDKKKGLVSIPNSLRSLGLNQTTPATGPAGSASQIVYSEDNSKLIVSVKGVPPQPGFLAVWDVQHDGSLSKDFQKVTPASGGLLPFSLTIIPGKEAILATDAGVGFDIFDFSSSGSSGAKNSSDSQSGNRNSVVEIKGQGATCWSQFSQKTGNFYLTDVQTSIITEVHIDDNLKGSVVKQYPQTSGSATIDLDIITLGDTDFLFVLQADVTSVAVVVLDAPGQARNKQSFDLSGPAKSSGLSIDKLNLQGMTTFKTKQ